MALVFAGGCVAYYIYYNQNSFVLNGLRVYTMVEESYKNLIEYFQYDKSTFKYDILDKKITEIIKDNKSLFILGKFNGNLEDKIKDFDNFINPLLAVTLTITNNEQNIVPIELDLTDYLNGFLFLNEHLSLSKETNKFWLLFLNFKKLYNFKYDEISNIDLNWTIIDKNGDLNLGKMLISFSKNDLKIENV